MNTLKILIPILLIISCANPPRENQEDPKPPQETEVLEDSWEAILKRYKEDIIIEPSLDTIKELIPGKEYYFEVRNIPLGEFGATINNGIIYQTEEGYRFRVSDFRDTVTLQLFIDVDNIQHPIYKMKKKVRK